MMNVETFVDLIAKCTKRSKSTKHAGLQTVVLNACNSGTTAKRLYEVTSIPSIGTSGLITDKTARTFSKQFWSDIFAGRTVTEAFEKAKPCVDLATSKTMSESRQFHLYHAKRGATITQLTQAIRNSDSVFLDKIVLNAPELLTASLNSYGEHFMTLAVKCGNKNAVHVGIELGLVNQLKSGADTTPLHTAVYYGWLEIIIMLLSSDGVKPKLVSRGGCQLLPDGHLRRRGAERATPSDLWCSC